MKCINEGCGYYNEERMCNCANSAFNVLSDCPNYKPKTSRDSLTHDAMHVQYGRPQHCPVCGSLNPSGFKLPEFCIACNGYSDFLPGNPQHCPQCGQKNPPNYNLPEDCLFCGKNHYILQGESDYRWCESCGYRYADEGSNYCNVCKKIQAKRQETKYDEYYVYDGSDYEYGWDSGNKDHAPKNNEQENKAKMRLIPMDLLREWLVPAYEEGLEKYYEESWRQGFPISTMIDGLLRHIEAFYYGGEDLDMETFENYGIEKTHLGAALFCLLSMCNTMQYYPELDDRFKRKNCPTPGEPCKCPTATINGKDGGSCEYFDKDTEKCLYGKI